MRALDEEFLLMMIGSHGIEPPWPAMRAAFERDWSDPKRARTLQGVFHRTARPKYPKQPNTCTWWLEDHGDPEVVPLVAEALD